MIISQNKKERIDLRIPSIYCLIPDSFLKKVPKIDLRIIEEPSKSFKYNKRKKRKGKLESEIL